MKTFKFISLYTIILFLLTITSCKKENGGCYDEQIYQQHKNDVCTMDCPGVTGCDGKIYCNECEALRHGIKLK